MQNNIEATTIAGNGPVRTHNCYAVAIISYTIYIVYTNYYCRLTFVFRHTSCCGDLGRAVSGSQRPVPAGHGASWPEVPEETECALTWICLLE